MSRKTITRSLFLLSVLLISSFRLYPQINIVTIDTSEYLPLFVSNALEYNLLIASSEGYYTEVERMILMGADVDYETDEGATPLIFAVANNKPETVDVLLFYDADVNKITKMFETPLLIAVKNRYFEIAESLIRNGADLNFMDKNGAAPLHYASIYGFLDITDLLLYYEADIDLKATDGTTPLMAAIWSGRADVTDLLIQNGANMEATDNYGFTPFLIAAQNGDTLLMNLLKDKGVDIFKQNIYRWDALDLAIRADNIPAAELLIKSGDAWKDPERKSINPYNIAVRYGRKDFIGLLEENGFPVSRKLEIDQLATSLSFKTDYRDFYTGFSLAFKEPLYNIGFIAGFDTKLWYTRVLVRESDYLYYQYLDKSSVVHAGLFKDFLLTDKIIGGNFVFTTSLSSAFSFGNKFKGTLVSPDSKFRIIPSVGIKYVMKNNITLFSNIEFMDSDFHRTGPVWSRFGAAYNFFFDNERAPVKVIKWY